MRTPVLAVAALLLAASLARAEVQPNSLFSPGAVLQRGMRLPVWGTARDGERVTVRLGGQSATTVARDGKWKVTLKPVKAGGPYTLTIAGDNTVTVPDVLVGDVWVCSGQSNMELPLWMAKGADAAIAASADPQLRLFSVAHNVQKEPVSDAKSAWVACGPKAVRDFSGVAYYFGRELRKALGVPIGLIHSSYGGTVLQAWASMPALQASPRMAQFMADFAKMKEPPIWATGQNTWAGLYNGMIAPLIPYGVRGAIWYQGEGNVGDGWGYRDLLLRLIANWRIDWGQGDFPFLVVQIAPYGKRKDEPGDSMSAEVREAQLLATRQCRSSALVVTMDVGDEVDIHPRDKETVGKRLALAARAVAHGEKVEWSGPAYRSMAIDGGRVTLTFDHAGKGLVAQGGGELTGFTIAGADGKFANARAVISGNTVVVSSPDVPEPAAVRYGWADCPVANLANSHGLPASPFRTDAFLLLSQPR